MIKNLISAVFLLSLATGSAMAETAAAAAAAASAPVVPITPAPVAPVKPVVEAPKLSAAQEARVNERAGVIRKQLADLSPVEQQAVMKQVRPARMPMSDDQRDALHDQRFAKTKANWEAKTPEDRADLREKMQARWQDLSPAEKTYQRDKLTERLKALPAADRQQVIDATQK